MSIIINIDWIRFIEENIFSGNMIVLEILEAII